MTCPTPLPVGSVAPCSYREVIPDVMASAMMGQVNGRVHNDVLPRGREHPYIELSYRIIYCVGNNAQSGVILPHITSRNYTSPYAFNSEALKRYDAQDPAFSFNRGFTMSSGQDAVVFLKRHGRWLDYSYDYYDPNFEPGASYNTPPIIDEKVRDVDHVWSDQLLLEYGEWRERFMLLREKILTGNR